MEWTFPLRKSHLREFDFFTGVGGNVFVNPTRDVPVRSFSQSEINAAGAAGQGTLATIADIETRLKSQGAFIAKGSPSSFHQGFFKVSPNALQLAKGALVGIEASRQLARQ